MRYILLSILFAFLFSFDIKAQTACSGTPPANPLTVDTLGISPDIYNLSASGYGETGLVFNWQIAPDSSNGNWANLTLPGFYYTIYSDTLLHIVKRADTWCRLAITCTNSGITSYTPSIFIPADTTLFIDLEDVPITVELISGSTYRFYADDVDTSAMASYSWHLGDAGMAITDDTVIHTYAAVGAYMTGLSYLGQTTGGIHYEWVIVPNVVLTYISGTVYYDLNQNAQMDSGEVGIPNQLIGNGVYGSTYTDANGDYLFQAALGSYTLELDPFNWNPVWFVTNAGGNMIAINATDTIVYDNNNFGVYIVTGYHNVGTYCWSLCSSPGFDSDESYCLINMGLLTENVNLTVDYDSNRQYISSTTLPSSVDTINHQLIYNLQLPPGFTYIEATYHSPASLQLFTVLNDSVNIVLLGNLDSDTTNNTANCESLVVGSFDPNDKQVNPSGEGLNHVVDPNHFEDLTYTIRFQNTGTAEAHNIVVIDTLDNSKLDLTTLQMMYYSHTGYVELQQNILKVRFDNILLPASNANEPESHGSFTFRIKKQSGLVDGIVISNKAYIYFDYNEPVITNDAFVTLDENLSTKEINLVNGFDLFPNPVDQLLTISLTNSISENRTYQVVDVTGRILVNEEFKQTGNTTLHVSKLNNGIYFIRVGGMTKKFSVLHP